MDLSNNLKRTISFGITRSSCSSDKNIEEAILSALSFVAKKYSNKRPDVVPSMSSITKPIEQSIAAAGYSSTILTTEIVGSGYKLNINVFNGNQDSLCKIKAYLCYSSNILREEDEDTLQDLE